MKRRHVLCGILGLAIVLAFPLTASAQGAGRPLSVVGLLDAGERLEWWAAFRQQIRELGYVEGQTVAFEGRFAAGSYERLPTMAQELVRLKVSVIVTSGSVAAEVAKRVTSAVPIVLATGDDPVSAGLVASLARPGGNITGVTSISTGLTGKRFQVLREIFPKLSRLAVLWHRDNAASARQVQELKSDARAAKVALQVLGVKSSDEFPAAFSAMTQERARAVFVISDPFLFDERRRLAELTLEHRLPSMHGPSEYVEAGGLLSYAPSYPDLFRRAAIYVDKILKGAKPGDLPIEQPTTFELVINLKTAKALGVTMPRALLLRANRVIE
jgi:putative ABC transport system substrate-binding protein